jgi:ABC-type amino acid transport substrate-binding protein
MKTRTLWAATLAAAALAATASAAPQAMKQCGTVAAAGQKWHVTVNGVACPAGKSLVRSLAAHAPAGSARYAGVHLGMRCQIYRTSAATAILCLSTSTGKAVGASTKPG